jgi:hypothetical protein
MKKDLEILTPFSFPSCKEFLAALAAFFGRGNFFHNFWKTA